MTLDPIALGAILALLIVAALLLWWLYRSRRTSALRDRFGKAEYDRTLDQHGARAKAEAALLEREKRVHALDLRALEPEEHTQFTERWHAAKARFVDDPAAAVGDADRVIGEVMRARGYPVDDFDARYESLTVDHGAVAQNYRAGHAIALRSVEGQATTEDLRQALIHHEALFGELVAEEPAEAASKAEASPA